MDNDEVDLALEATIMRACRTPKDRDAVTAIVEALSRKVATTMAEMAEKGLLDRLADGAYVTVKGRHPETPLDVPGLRVAFFRIKDEREGLERKFAAEPPVPGSNEASFAKGQVAALSRMAGLVEAKLFALDSTACDELAEVDGPSSPS